MTADIVDLERPDQAVPRPMSWPRSTSATGDDILLPVNDLRTQFDVMDGTVRAVDGVSYSIEPGQTLGLVGESGCGKSVTALTIMRLLDIPPARIASGQIYFKGRDLLALPEEEMRKVRGNEIAMIFQEPMTSLNPVHTVGDQISEASSCTRSCPRRRGATRPSSRSARSASTTPSGGSSSTPTRCPAACASG